MLPNLNNWRFTKLHRKKRIINLGKGMKGKSLSVYNQGIILLKSKLITINQLDSIKKLINKKMKKHTKKKEKILLIRRNFNLGLTKKPLQVRMGKGKGSPVNWVYPFSKNRIFIECIKQKRLFKLLNKLSNKLAVKVKLITGKSQLTKKVNKVNKTRCIKEL